MVFPLPHLDDPNKHPWCRGHNKRGNCYITATFRGVPNKADKIRSGYLTLAFSGAHKRVVLLRNPCILGVPNKGGQNQKWLPYPCLLEGPKKERNWYATPTSLGIPNTGDKSDVATSPLPSRHSKEGDNTCILGGPQQSANQS